jgi:hypothetical protein
MREAQLRIVTAPTSRYDCPGQLVHHCRTCYPGPLFRPQVAALPQIDRPGKQKTFALLRIFADISTSQKLVSICAFNPLAKLVHALKIRQALLSSNYLDRWSVDDITPHSCPGAQSGYVAADCPPWSPSAPDLQQVPLDLLHKAQQYIQYILLCLSMRFFRVKQCYFLVALLPHLRQVPALVV